MSQGPLSKKYIFKLIFYASGPHEILTFVFLKHPTAHPLKRLDVAML